MYIIIIYEIIWRQRDMTNQELKSKVMSLGNRLTPRMGGDRSAAFVQAWAICKAGGLELAVKGVTFSNRQEALRRLAAYDPSKIRAWIAPEPENQADPAAMAVMVMIQGGKGCYSLGYLPKDKTVFAKVLKAVSIRVLDGDIRSARIALSA
jgi:hypothetical protein